VQGYPLPSDQSITQASHDRVAIASSAEHRFRKQLSLIGETMDKYVCEVCDYIYDPEKGDSAQDIAPGTAFEDLPDDWFCPECVVGKEMFERQLE